MVEIGDSLYGKEVFDVLELSNGWKLAKTENGKNTDDFRVKLVNDSHPRGVTIKHAHFAIDFYGKYCNDEEDALVICKGLYRIWHGEEVVDVVKDVDANTDMISGYPIDYIYYAMNWILEQEDINYTEIRSDSKQAELDALLSEFNMETPQGRDGGALAMSIFCEIAAGEHPVEVFYRVNLPI